MPEAISVGPLVLPTLRVGTLVILLFASWLVAVLAERFQLTLGWTAKTADRALWLGFLVARAGFVAVNWQAYQLKPWTALYIWQPGYSLVAGFLASAFFLCLQIFKLKNQRFAYSKVFFVGYIVAMLGILLFMGSTRLDFGSSRLKVGDRAPNFELIDLSGSIVQLSDLKGNAVVLNFWATWCPPCRREMPTLEMINNKYKNEGAVVVGVNVGERGTSVKRYIDSVDVTYRIWISPDETSQGSQQLYQSYGGVGLPTTIFIDKTGIIRDFQVGELSSGIVQSRIEAMLK